MILIEPSILAADYGRLQEQVQEAQAAGIQALQIDVMDGHFVPNITFGPGIVQAIRPLVSLFLDVHLMITQPERFLQVFAEAGADVLVAGSAVFRGGSVDDPGPYGGNMRAIRAAAAG